MTARLINTTVVGQETTIKGMVGMKSLKMLARKHAMPVQVRNLYSMTFYNIRNLKFENTDDENPSKML